MVGVWTRLRLSTRPRFNTRLQLNILSESDVATSADRRECAEVSKARRATVAEVFTARHEHVFIGDERGKLIINKLKGSRAGLHGVPQGRDAGRAAVNP